MCLNSNVVSIMHAAWKFELNIRLAMFSLSSFQPRAVRCLHVRLVVPSINVQQSWHENLEAVSILYDATGECGGKATLRDVATLGESAAAAAAASK